MRIRQLNNSEYSHGIALSLNAFIESGSVDFDVQGLETFKSFIYNRELMDKPTIFGVFENDILIGIIGIKDSCAHISLFFINPKYHSKGVGRKLFDYAYASQRAEQITINSSSLQKEMPGLRGFSFNRL